jgi:hypothetical protein
MTTTPLRRKPSNRRSGSARPSPAARPGGPGEPRKQPKPVRTRRLSRGVKLLLMAMTYGSAIALFVVGAGFTSVVRNGATPDGTHRPAAGGGHDHQGAAGTAGGRGPHANHDGPRADVRITARHLGNLVVDIKAEVSLNKDRDSLMKAKAVAYTDMVQMPGAHATGPFPLRAAPGEPGRYEATTTVPMPGDYKIRVVVEEPVRGEGTTTVVVGTTYGGQGQ